MEITVIFMVLVQGQIRKFVPCETEPDWLPSRNKPRPVTAGGLPGTGQSLDWPLLTLKAMRSLVKMRWEHLNRANHNRRDRFA
jgi:hypothetical protein